MQGGKIVVARIWPRFEGVVSSRAGVVSGFPCGKYKTIIIYLMKNSEQPNYFEQHGFSTYYVSTKKFLRIFNFRVLWGLRRILKLHKVDIVQSHGHLACVYGTIAAKLAGVAAVFCHVPGLNRSRRLRRKLTNLLVFRWASKVLTTGKTVKDDVVRSNFCINPERVVSIGNSIDYDRFSQIRIDKPQAKAALGLATDSFVFGTVGRVVPTKGHKYLIEAFARVKRQICNAHLVLIGDGRSAENLKKQAMQTGFGNAIHFLGRRDDIDVCLRAMDVFVLSSIAEGQPRSLLEAMAAQVPCIGTRVGGVAEILGEGEFGYLVDAAEPGALAEMMIKAGRAGEIERGQMVKRAKKRVAREYCHKAAVERLKGIYERQLVAKWGFSKYLKYGVRLAKAKDTFLPVNQLHVQYNPERFEQYKSLHKGPGETVLDMKASCHCRLLAAYKRIGNDIYSRVRDYDYYKMQRLYGKSHKSAVSKVERFVELYESIKKVGFNTSIVVVDKPIFSYDYNQGYEIYTGHHRVACCIELGLSVRGIRCGSTGILSTGS